MEPGLRQLEAACQGQNGFVGVPAADDLQADRKALGGQAGRDRYRRMPGEIDREGHAPADERIDRFAVDIRRSDRIAVGGVADGRDGERRGHDEVVALEHGLQADKNSGPQNVVERVVDRRNCLGVDQHLPELGSQLLRMLAEQIDALLLPVASDCAVVDRDEAHPEPRQRVVVGPEVQFHLVDFDAAARKRLDCRFDDACDALIDREVAELRTEGDAESSSRAFRARASSRRRRPEASAGRLHAVRP